MFRGWLPQLALTLRLFWAVSEEYFTASLSKVNYTGTSAERRPMTPVAQYFKYVTANFISSDFANSQLWLNKHKLWFLTIFQFVYFVSLVGLHAAIIIITTYDIWTKARHTLPETTSKLRPHPLSGKNFVRLLGIPFPIQSRVPNLKSPAQAVLQICSIVCRKL